MNVPIPCHVNEGGHCWHAVWKPSPVQPGQYNGSEMRCCWCSDTRPLTVNYALAKPHGPHAPDNPTGNPAQLWR